MGISALATGVVSLAAPAVALASHESAGQPQPPSGLFPPDSPNPAPSISGTAQDGATLTANRGGWNDATLTLNHRWIRCDDANGTTGCVFLHADDQSTYVLTSEDIGKTIKLRVRAQRQGGSREVDSAPTSAVRAAPPSVQTAPSFSGAALVGSTLVGSSGSFSGGTAPVTDDSYQWERCGPPDFSTCSGIPGATALNYTIVADDVGYQLRLRERATYGPAGETTDAYSTNSPEVPVPQTGEVTPTLISPFPVIAIAGVSRRSGARLVLLRVRGPRGVLVSVRCFGLSCPRDLVRRKIANRRIVRFRVFERRMPVGTTIVFRITQPGRIGKYTRIRIRARRRPARIDRCLEPGQIDPVPCPEE
jgi:hypothetical protein